MSINDLLAFATGARFAHRVDRAWSRIDDEVAARTGLASGEEWLAVRGYRQADGADYPLCRTEYYINRAFAAVGRLLQRHTGPIFPLIEDLFGVSIVEVHQEIAAVLIAPAARRRSQGRTGITGTRGAAHLQDVRRRDRTGHREHPPGIPLSSFDDDAAGQRPVTCRPTSNTNAPPTPMPAGCGSATTLADSLREAAQTTPQRVAVVDGNFQLDCADSPRAGAHACPGDVGPDADGQRGVVHAAQLARGRRRLPGRDPGRNGGQPHPAVAARP